jgi:hypothetical protein
MALSTYTELKAALATALHRSDLTTPIVDFITLAEDRLNKRLRLRAMEVRATSSVSTEYVALPAGFLAMRNVQINSTPRVSIEYASPEWMDVNYPSTSSSGKPKFYTLVGGEIQLAPVPDGTYTLEMDYFKKLDIAADATNWVLTNAPRLYYYGALLEAATFLDDEKNAGIWAKLLEEAIKEVEHADSRDRFPAAGLVMRFV